MVKCVNVIGDRRECNPSHAVYMIEERNCGEHNPANRIDAQLNSRHLRLADLRHNANLIAGRRARLQFLILSAIEKTFGK